MLMQVVRRLVQTGVGRRAAGERILVTQRTATHRRIEAERVATTSTATTGSVMAHHRAPVRAQVNVFQHLSKRFEKKGKTHVNSCRHLRVCSHLSR